MTSVGLRAVGSGVRQYWVVIFAAARPKVKGADGRLTVVKVLFVGKYQQQAVLHLPVVDDTVQFLSCFLHALLVGRVDHEDETLGTCIVFESNDRQSQSTNSHVNIQTLPKKEKGERVRRVPLK